MLNIVFGFIAIVAYFLVGGFSVAKLFGPYPEGWNAEDEKALYVAGVIFWPISVVIGAARKGVELALRDRD